MAEDKKTKRPGRPKKVIPYVEVPGGAQARPVSLDEIDMDDTTFRFRVGLRVGSLADSIKDNGQQFPVLLRKREGQKFQLISGFRRIAAIQKLGWDKVNAIVRDDLSDDADACKVSILENEARKTYNDLDRAHAILAYRRMGKSNAEIQEIFSVGARQRQRLEKLVTFPKNLQDAVAGEVISSTSAVRLMQHFAKHVEDTEADEAARQVQAEEFVGPWIKRILDEALSYKQLGSALKEDLAEKKEGQKVEFYVEREKDGETSLRIRPISIDGSLTSDQRKALVADLKKVIKFVQGL